MNLHTHGLHVTPDGDGDNVLREIWPAGTPESYSAYCGTGPDYFFIGSNNYRYNFLPGHPVGSYWYHPHKHGSTTFQVANGMAGALIVEDGQHNLFTIFDIEQKRYQSAFEKIVIIQQVALYPPEPPSVVAPTDLPDGYAYVNALELYGLTNDEFPGQDKSSTQEANASSSPATVLTVNGQYVPTITMGSEEIQAWRMINTSWTEDTILTWSFGSTQDANGDQPIAYAIGTDGNPLPASIIGRQVDQLSSPTKWELDTLAPGQRVDLLVQAPAIQAGQSNAYTLSVTRQGPNGPETDPLLYIIVNGDPNTNTTDGYKPPTVMPERTAFTVLPRPEPVPINVGTLDPRFDPATLGDDQQPICFSFLPVGQSAINGASFNPAGPQRTLHLNKTSIWSVAGQQAPHIFHIHVNPFVLLARIAESGDDVTHDLYPHSISAEGDQFLLDGIFRDTLLIHPHKATTDAMCGLPDSVWDEPGTIFASYQRDFCGNYVMHCHVLEHEDTGMMEWVQVVNDQGEICPDPTSSACQPSGMPT